MLNLNICVLLRTSIPREHLYVLSHTSDEWLNIWVSGGHSGQLVATPAGPQGFLLMASTRARVGCPYIVPTCGAGVPLATGLEPWLSHTVQQLSGSCAPTLVLVAISHPSFAPPSFLNLLHLCFFFVCESCSCYIVCHPSISVPVWNWRRGYWSEWICSWRGSCSKVWLSMKLNGAQLTTHKLYSVASVGWGRWLKAGELVNILAFLSSWF